MADFRIIEGSCGPGTGRYEVGLFNLPDGSERGVECLSTLTVRNEEALRGRWAGEIVGGIRGAIDATTHLPFPLRLAAMSASRGMGLIDRALRTEALLEVSFADGARIVAAIELGIVERIQNDREVLKRAQSRSITLSAGRDTPRSDIDAPQMPVARDANAPAAASSLSSIFHYEKRKGRLRRVARTDPSDGS